MLLLTSILDVEIDFTIATDINFYVKLSWISSSCDFLIRAGSVRAY